MPVSIQIFMVPYSFCTIMNMGPQMIVEINYLPMET